jgi:hypothetical protein
MATYRYNADHVAQARGKYNPQKKNMGMFEWHIDGLVAGGQEVLMLSLSNVTVPGYRVGRGEINYLNGTVFYPTKPEPLEEVSISFRDYHDAGTRETLERIFRKVYNPVTGTMGLPRDIKSQATLVLLREDDSGGRPYYLDGVFPMGEPNREFDFGDGEQAIMEMSLSVDFVIGRDI